MVLAAFTSLLLFLVVRHHKDAYLANTDTVDAVNNFFDAMGLGAFTVTGTQIAISTGFGDNLFFAVALGVITGTGGGLLRDIIVNEIPVVLKKHVYAVASIVGGLLYFLLHRQEADAAASAVVTIGVVFGLRVAATHYRWNLPRAL